VVYPSTKPPEISVINQILIIRSITIDNHKLSLVIIGCITTIISWICLQIDTIGSL